METTEAEVVWNLFMDRLLEKSWTEGEVYASEWLQDWVDTHPDKARKFVELGEMFLDAVEEMLEDDENEDEDATTEENDDAAAN